MPARRLLALELIPTGLLAAAVAAGLWGFSYDDSWITYRYADNWAHGRGLVFNPGEAVLGTTAPGWALALGALSRASAAAGLGGLGVPAWGTLLTVASLWWLAAALPALWLPAGSPLRPGLPLVLGTLALTSRWSLELLGGEAFPAAALAATAAWLALSGPPEAVRRETLAGLAAAAAILCRLDAALAAAAIGLALWIVRRRFPWRFALAGMAPLLPYLAWLQIEFGAVVPNTLAAKQTEAAIAARGYGAWQWEWLERSFDTAGRWWLAALAAFGAALAVRGALAARGGLAVRRGRRIGHGAGAAPPRATAGAALAALAAWVVLHELFYRLTGVPFAPWYGVVTLVAALALGAFAAASLGGWLAAWPGVGARARKPIAVLFAALLALPVLLPGARFLAATWGEPPDARTRLYAAVGRHLRRHAASDARVASMEIGALAYAGDRPVLDLVGLVDPEVVEARRAGRLAEHVAAEAPEYILVPPPFLGRELGDVMRHPEIRARYAPAARFSDPEYEHDPVTLYRRRSP